MRKIDEIIIHCSATPEGRDVTAADVDRWHRQRGFKCIGYHYLIRLDGTVETGRPLETVGAHCLGHNARSIGICYAGGCDNQMQPKDTRTPKQKAAMALLIKKLLQKYPSATIHGHCEFAAKACPCFNVKEIMP